MLHRLLPPLKAEFDSRFPKTNPVIKPFNNRFFMNWAIVSAPRHPLIKRVLETIVKIIEAEFKGKPFIKLVAKTGASASCAAPHSRCPTSQGDIAGNDGEGQRRDRGGFEGHGQEGPKRV